MHRKADKPRIARNKPKPNVERNWAHVQLSFITNPNVSIFAMYLKKKS